MLSDKATAVCFIVAFAFFVLAFIVSVSARAARFFPVAALALLAAGAAAFVFPAAYNAAVGAW